MPKPLAKTTHEQKKLCVSENSKFTSENLSEKK